MRAPWLTGGYVKLPRSLEGPLARGLAPHRGRGVPGRRRLRRITDRRKDVIKSGGEWVSSLDLESVISQHEGIAEVAVYAVPDAKWGERPAAVVVEREAWKGKLTPETVREFLQGLAERGKLERYAIPEKITIVEAIPKTSVGRIDKKRLRGEVPPA